MADALTLIVNGQRYEGWTSIRVSRGIDRAVGDFDIEVTERWTGQNTPWRILPFSPCTLYAGSDLLLTGYVDTYAPSFGPTSHAVRIKGRSLTEDLVDCTPDIKVRPVRRLHLAGDRQRDLRAVRHQRRVAGGERTDPVRHGADGARCETAFSFLERLGRMCGVLLTDNPAGNLVLTTAGSTNASRPPGAGGEHPAGQRHTDLAQALQHLHREGPGRVGGDRELGRHAGGSGGDEAIFHPGW